MAEKTLQLSDSPAYKWIILGNVMLATFMAILDATVVNTALPVIMGTLGVSMNQIEWILTGYMLSMATILSTTGWLSNRFGYKNIFLLGVLIFTFGSFMCGNSDSINQLIFWRIIEGIGGGIIMPVGMSIVTSVFPPEERSTALGFWAISTAASVSFGPMIGGYLVDNFTWNYIFYINVPIGIFCIFFSVVVQKSYKLESALKFDIPGFITSSTFLPVFLYGLSQVNSSTNPSGWKSPVVMGCMWIAVVFFVLFIFTELNVKTPLIDIRVFKHKNFSIANFVIFIFAVGMFGSTFLIPLYLQDTLGYSAFHAGLLFLPVGLIQAFVSPSAGRIIKYIDPRIVIIFGLILLSTSFFMNNNLTLQTDRSYVLFSLILRGAGLGILFPPLLAVSLVNVSAIRMAQASSITNITRQVGGSVGVAFFTYTLSRRRTFHTQIYSETIDYTGETYQNTVESLSQFYSSTGADNAVAAAKMAKHYIIEWINTEAYIKGINDDFLIGAIITVLAIIPALLLTPKKKDKS